MHRWFGVFQFLIEWPILTLWAIYGSSVNLSKEGVSCRTLQKNSAKIYLDFSIVLCLTVVPFFIMFIVGIVIFAVKAIRCCCMTNLDGSQLDYVREPKRI